MNLTNARIQTAKNYWDSFFVVREHTTTGYNDFFYEDYDLAYKNARRFLEEEGASRVDIQSPWGDCLRAFANGMVQVK